MAYYEIYHSGIKGMKWGVRRYQNPDGSLTTAGKKRYANSLRKELEKTSRKNGHNQYEAVQTMKARVKEHLTDDDYKRLGEKRTKYVQASKTQVDHEQDIDKYATKVAKKLYNKELSRNGDAYPTERDKDKLYEYYKYDEGYAKAEKAHPEWFKSESADKAWNNYREESKSIANRLLGEHGDVQIKNLSSKWYSRTLNDVVADAIESLEFNNALNEK